MHVLAVVVLFSSINGMFGSVAKQASFPAGTICSTCYDMLLSCLPLYKLCRRQPIKYVRGFEEQSTNRSSDSGVVESLYDIDVSDSYSTTGVPMLRVALSKGDFGVPLVASRCCKCAAVILRASCTCTRMFRCFFFSLVEGGLSASYYQYGI